MQQPYKFDKVQQRHIDYENRKLLQRLLHTQGSKEQPWNELRPRKKSLHGARSRRWASEVDQANQRMYERLNRAKPCVGSVRSITDHVKYYQTMSRITRQNPLKYRKQADEIEAKQKFAKKRNGGIASSQSTCAISEPPATARSQDEYEEETPRSQTTPGPTGKAPDHQEQSQSRERDDTREAPSGRSPIPHNTGGGT